MTRKEVLDRAVSKTVNYLVFKLMKHNRVITTITSSDDDDVDDIFIRANSVSKINIF